VSRKRPTEVSTEDLQQQQQQQRESSQASFSQALSQPRATDVFRRPSDEASGGTPLEMQMLAELSELRTELRRSTDEAEEHRKWMQSQHKMADEPSLQLLAGVIDDVSDKELEACIQWFMENPDSPAFLKRVDKVWHLVQLGGHVFWLGRSCCSSALRRQVFKAQKENYVATQREP
jgi:hypothetical protein